MVTSRSMESSQFDESKISLSELLTARVAFSHCITIHWEQKISQQKSRTRIFYFRSEPSR